MANRRSGVPAKVEERGNSRGAVSLETRHRAIALLGYALDIIEPKGKRHGDFVDAIVGKAIDDPLDFIERVNKLTGGAAAGAQPNAAAIAGLAGVFAGAAAVAAGRASAEPQPVDVTYSEVEGVQSGDSTDQAIDW